MKKKFIIITSIFPPSKGIKKFAKFKDWQLLVVGDKKTPKDWSLRNATYLSPEDQEKLGYEILKHLPWNHYSRKMVGYLYAISQGAEIIYDTDDDNIPIENWFEPKFEGVFDTIGGHPFANVYSFYTQKKIWPRGIPLREILSKPRFKKTKKAHKIGIWQFLADGDPDVDAIYRLTDNEHVIFDKEPPLVLDKGCLCPINSQNTFFHKDAFLLLYLPAFVTFRFTDILRGLVAQPILWVKGMNTGFGTATVFQDRNKHDYFKDFESELPAYLYSDKIAYLAKDTATNSSIGKNMTSIYEELLELKIVKREEIELLGAWLADLKRAQEAAKDQVKK